MFHKIMYQRVQGAVGFFYIHLTTILPANLPVNKFLIGSDLTEFGHESVAPLFWPIL